MGGHEGRGDKGGGSEGGGDGGCCGGSGADGGPMAVAQYADVPQCAGRGSLYRYVVVAPSSYEHAHTSTTVDQ